MPQNQQRCPPLSVAQKVMLGLLRMLSSGMDEQLTMGSSLDTMISVFSFSLLSSSSEMVYSSKIQRAEGQPRILAVREVWNSMRLCDALTSAMLTSPIRSQNSISLCRLTVSQMQRLTKNFWQTLPMSSTTRRTLSGGARATSPAMLTLGCPLMRQRSRQLPPKLVPTRQMGERGQQAATLCRATSSSWQEMAVKGMGLVISLLMPLLLRHTLTQPSSAAGFTNSLMQFISLPPVRPCITNRIGGSALSQAAGNQSREMCPPSYRKMGSRWNLKGKRGSLMLYTDCRKGWARQGVGRQVLVGGMAERWSGESLPAVSAMRRAKFFIFIKFIVYIRSLQLWHYNGRGLALRPPPCPSTQGYVLEGHCCAPSCGLVFIGVGGGWFNLNWSDH